jgi:hypothetical protein
LRYSENSQSGKETRNLSFVIITLTVFVVLAKLSSIPLVLGIAYVVYSEFRKSSLKDFPRFILICVLLALPQIVRNVILSGYLVYPVVGSKFFNFDWTIPTENVIQIKRWIDSWARFPGKTPDEILGKGLSSWFPVWLSNAALTMPFIYLQRASVILLIHLVWRTRYLLGIVENFWPMYIMVMAGVSFWFISAPDIRFGYGFIASLIILLIAPPAFDIFTKVSNKRFLHKGLIYFCLALTIIITSTDFRTYIGYSGILNRYRDFALKPEIKFPEEDVKLGKVLIDGQAVYYPLHEYQQCWLSPLPCTPFVSPTLEFRGKSLRDGFRAKPL